MSMQYDSLAFSEDDHKCIVTCMCGTVTHGVVQINKDFSDKACFLSFYLAPYADGFFARVKNAIAAFRNQPIESDLFLTDADTDKLGTWLQIR